MLQTVATPTAVGWLYVRDGRLLGVRTRGRDRFHLPGGRPEPGETAEQALVRSVREQLGLELADVRPAFTAPAAGHGLAADGDTDTDGGRRPATHCFSGAALGEPRPGGEVEELAWLRIPVDPRAAAPVHAVLARLNR